MKMSISPKKCNQIAVAVVLALFYGDVYCDAIDIGTAAPQHTDFAPPCASDQNQVAMSFCYADLAKKAEKAEAEQYSKMRVEIARVFGPDTVRAFELSEEKWRAYRDAECNAVMRLYLGGSLANTIEFDCRSRVADQRALELQRGFKMQMEGTTTR